MEYYKLPLVGSFHYNRGNNMRETLKDWKDERIATNGETQEFEVMIKDNKLGDMESSIYEENFAGIPDELLNRKVTEYARIIDSSVPERIGAYSLRV